MTGRIIQLDHFDNIETMTHTLGTLLTTYIQQRQQGHAMDDVVAAMQEAAQQLPRDDRRRLGELVLEWEERYGKNPLAAPAPTPAAPTPVPVAPAAPVIRPIAAPPAAPATGSVAVATRTPAPFATKFLDPSKLEQFAKANEQMVNCPFCGRPNPRGSEHCVACGQSMVIRQLPTTRRFDDTAMRRSVMDAYFTPNSTLIIAVRGAKGILQAFPREKLIVGRNTAQTFPPVNIDLEPFNAESLGVSRNHAEIRCQNDTLVLVDLKSTNGTFINEQRVYSHEVRVVRNGDELRFGKLVMKVTFKT
jgi:predicted component of type VI protein secretion system